jgi:hypothetical protein
LVKDVEVFEANLNSVDSKKIKNSRGMGLYSLKFIEQLKKQVETSHNYLSKEVTSIETRLFITKQMLGRDVEANLDA